MAMDEAEDRFVYEWQAMAAGRAVRHGCAGAEFQVGETRDGYHRLKAWCHPDSDSYSADCDRFQACFAAACEAVRQVEIAMRDGRT